MFFLNIIIHYVTGWWFGTFGLFFPSYWGHVIPTDFHSIIFQRGRSTTNQVTMSLCLAVYLQPNASIFGDAPQQLLEETH